LLGWLLTYNGLDCGLWHLVHEKCMESRLCSELAKTLMNELNRHRCFGYAPN